MAALRKINERNQITLPPSVLRDAGVARGAFLSIEVRDGTIVLEQKRLADADFVKEDWDALDRLVRAETRGRRFTEYANPKSARAHLRRPRR